MPRPVRQPVFDGWDTPDTPRATSAPNPENLPAAVRRELPHQKAEERPELADKLVVLVDAHSLIYQVFHALPPMSSPSGLPVGAVHGFVGDLVELVNRLNPDYLFCAFDRSEVTFRNELYVEYKAHRDPMPDELRQQIPLIRQALATFGIGQLECASYEADDILATVAAEVDRSGGRCLLVTSDKDCRQLISDHVQLYNIRKNEFFGRQELWDTWGVRPDQVVDFQAMVGDPVDNIPGIPLIGPKLAQSLLEQFDTLEGVLENAESVSGPKRRENLKAGREAALLSRSLVELRTDAPCAVPWSHGIVGRADRHEVETLCNELGFRRLAQRALETFAAGQTRQTAAQSEAVALEYQTVTTQPQLQALVETLRTSRRIAVDTETTGTNPRGSQLVGLSFAWAPGQAAYIPVLAPAGETVLPWESVRAAVAPILEDPAIEKVGQNLKFDIVVLRSCGIALQGLAVDTMVADYLLDPGRRNHTLDDLAARLLSVETTTIKELIGSGKNQKRMDEVPLEQIGPYASEDADIPLRLAPLLQQRLEDAGLWQLYCDIELPLVEVLAELEYVGIRVNVDRLKELSERFGIEAESLRAEIEQLAGHSFNIDSPKQLRTVLFEQLGLPIVKRTKTGPSTDAEVLSALAPQHPLPAKIVQYRQVTKLKNTYVDALPLLVNPTTGRVHTSLRQDVAATGRLSSTDPNLQNIPVRTEDGRAIRSAFEAGPEGWRLLAADYSQIELRMLAHFSGDEALRKAYADDADIHRRVAAEVNGIAEADVTADMRRMAKTINFGIVYGQSPFGLARTLGIDKEQAADYIDAYFTRYPGVRDFMLNTLARCRRNGYVQTMLGRRRNVQGVRDISKLDDTRRWSLTEPERIAVNTVIQGSAADLIKQAMISVRAALRDSRLDATLLLQIHDELLFEVAPDACRQLTELCRDKMTSGFELSVPLKVDVKIGANWAACEAV